MANLRKNHKEVLEINNSNNNKPLKQKYEECREWLISRLDIDQKIISEFEDTAIETLKTEKQRIRDWGGGNPQYLRNMGQLLNV